MRSTHFIRQFLKNPKEIGSLAPSSRWLGQAMTRNIDFSRVDTIIEYGSGTGTITREILRQKSPHTKLFAYEIDESFRRHLESLSGDNFHPTFRSIEEVTGRFAPHSVDVIVSCLPLGSLNSSFVDRLLRDATTILKPWGLFIQFQYFLQNREDIARHFEIEQISWEWRNFPPAGVYRARNTKRS